MKSSQPNLFVFDIDGTLMAPGGSKIDSEALEAIDKVKSSGEIVLASARPVQGITNLNCGAIDHIIALNGSLVLSSGKIKAAFPLPREFVCKMLYSHRNYKNIWFYSEDEWFSGNNGTEEYFKELNAVIFDAIPLHSYNGQEILKITISDPGNMDKILPELSFTTDVRGSYSNKFYYEITSSKADKFSAIKHLSVNPEARVFCFCDSDNDLSLLMNSYYSCVPSNGSPKAQSAASYISEFKYGKGVLDSVNHVTRSVL